MTLTFRTVNYALKSLTSLLCRIEVDALQQVPRQGPLILVCNHVNFLDIPLIYTHLQPRPVTGFAKVETWDSPILGPLFDLWGAIPLRRGEADTAALRKGLKALQENKIVAIAPEGTRSGNGQLQRGRPGIVSLALRSGAGILPLVYYGGESLRANMRQFRRTDFHIKVGPSFHIETHGVRVSRELRQRITDEIMYRLALLLPEVYRGVYAEMSANSPKYLRFGEGV